MIEIWKDAVGYERYFKVSNLGRIFSKRTNRILKTHLLKTGYLSFCTRLGGRQSKAVSLKVHRLVATAFLDNDASYPIVNHIDGDKLNNKASNLEWVTYKDNIDHAYATGLIKIKNGLENRNSKLTKDVLKYIFFSSRKYGGTKSFNELAKELGISKTTINDFLCGNRYVEQYNEFLDILNKSNLETK